MEQDDSANRTGGGEDIHLRVADACKARREYLERTFSSSGRSYQKAGLVASGRVLFALATRYLDPVVRPGTKDEQASDFQRSVWELEWYSNFLTALERTASAFQEAVRSGKIKPRDVATRTPIPVESLRDWLGLDIQQAMKQANSEFWKAVPHQPWSAAYPDGVALGPGGIGFDLEDLMAWLEDEGIASPGEIRPRIGLALEAENSASFTPSPSLPLSNYQPLPPSTLAIPPGWEVKEPERMDDLNCAIHKILKAAHAAGMPLPTAEDILAELRRNHYDGVIEVMPDGVKRRNSKGIKLTPIAAIGQRIDRLTALTGADKPIENR